MAVQVEVAGFRVAAWLLSASNGVALETVADKRGWLPLIPSIVYADLAHQVVYFDPSRIAEMGRRGDGVKRV